MAIGKAAVVLMCFMIAAVAMISIFAIATKDKSTNEYYYNTSNTINGTIQAGEKITSGVVGFNTALILVVAIMFFGTVLFIYRKK